MRNYVNENMPVSPLTKCLSDEMLFPFLFIEIKIKPMILTIERCGMQPGVNITEKLYYCTPTGPLPVSVLFFVNNLRLICLQLEVG